RRRGGDGDAGDQVADKPPAAVGRLDSHQLRGVLGARLRDLRLFQREVEDGTNLPGDAEMTEQVGTVRLDLEREDGVARVQLAQVLPQRGALIEDENSGRILAKAELDSGAQHAGGRNAEKGFRFDPSVVQPRAGYGIRHSIAHSEVPCAGNDVHDSRAGGDRGDLVLR